ncbi:unnamed protein product [Durusdinium trenchii]|uniref:Uncharacterized protein n=1 Tax=Durusdinium trenchii TaxID=1381693 RepID=A0ABP0KEL5_9DINO
MPDQLFHFQHAKRGDREHFELAKSQTGFLQFVCIPLWQELVRLETLVQNGLQPVMPRKSMSLNPPSAYAHAAHAAHESRESNRRRQVEPLNLMPELRESHTMSMGETDPSGPKLNHSSSFQLGVAVRLLAECQDNLLAWQNLQSLPNAVNEEP